MPTQNRASFEYAVTLFNRTMGLFGIPATFDQIWRNDKGTPFVAFFVEGMEGQKLLPVEWFEKDNAEEIVSVLQAQKVLCPNDSCTQFIGDESILPAIQLPGACNYCMQRPKDFIEHV